MADKVTDILDRIRWPHVAIVAAIIAGVVAILILAPDTTIGHVIRAIGLVTGAGGTFGTARSAGMLRESIPSPEPVEPRRMPPHRKRNEGSIDVHFVAVVLSVVWALLMTVPRAWHAFQACDWFW
jgi:hypothetical protein